MHCPTCGQTYIEGTQRFCDADGSRLISISDDEYRRGKQNVFSDVLPVAGTDAAYNEASVQRPLRFGKTETLSPIVTVESLFFVEEDEDEVIHFAPKGNGEYEIVEQPETRSFGRKVDPYKIPAGHIEVGEHDHPSLNNLDFDAEDPAAFIGRVVKGRYRVIELIGEDETGFAFVAEDRIVDERRVVVRILTGEELDDVTKSIFAEERISLSHLTHPNVVRLIDSGQFVDGTTFLISEYVDALTIADVLQIHGPLNSARAGRLIRQAGYALSDVHHEGVLHRDLRPDLLMVLHTDSGNDQIKISNFGVYDGEPTDENLAYKAPEILDGRIPTLASDIYALGVIAFQTLTGRTPFEGDSAKATLKAVRAGIVTRPTDLRDDLTSAVDQVFEKALSPDPTYRYPTAREFGDALFSALATGTETSVQATVSDEPTADTLSTGSETAAAVAADVKLPTISLPKAAAFDRVPVASVAPAWTRRSPDPPAEPDPDRVRIAVIGFLILAVIAAGVWYYVLRSSAERDEANASAATRAAVTAPDSRANGDVPPKARPVAQPANTTFFQSDRAALKGDLYRNFVGFSLYYPNDWKVTPPQEGTDGQTRGKFLDIARDTPDGKMMEQMLVSYYPTTGTYAEDAAKFPDLVRETNETLQKLIPNYQVVSEGETKLNGGWRAYEVKFQASGSDGAGGRMNLWGRRIFIPPARPGVRAGFEITLLATSNSADVRSVDDVGTRGELARVLETFEPGSNF
ncbi:MAG: serine/threonine-protein kinase [Acidobacteriota bacterium]